MVLVTQNGADEHPNRSEYIWWRNEALCLCNAEFHTVFENDREEVGDGISDLE